MTPRASTAPNACRRCRNPFGPRRRHSARGLCRSCRVWASTHGRLGGFAPTRTPIDAAEHDRLAAQGLSTRAIARALGVTPGAIGNHRHRRNWRTP